MFYKIYIQTKKIEDMGFRKQKIQQQGSKGRNTDVSHEANQMGVSEGMLPGKIRNEKYSFYVSSNKYLQGKLFKAILGPEDIVINKIKFLTF